MRRERRGRCLALALALAVACLLALPGRGARGFDVRVGDPFGSPHLPGVLPAPFACFGPAPEGDRAHGRAFGVLHANLFDLPGLTLDGAGAAAWHRRAWLRVGISRLAAPEFAEWSAALAAGGRVGPMVECRRLWTQPSSELIRTAAIVPEQAWSVLAGWTQPVGRRATVRVWGQDLIRRGAVRATGLRPRWGGEVRLRAAPGVEVRAARQWDRDGSATRIECAWELTSDLSVGGGWRDPRRGRGCWLRAGWGKASAWVWSESMVAELPATSGIGLVWESHSHGIAGAATHAPGPAGQSAGQSVSRSAGQPAGRSVGQPAGQSVGQPTDQPAVPSVGRPARLGRSAGR